MTRFVLRTMRGRRARTITLGMGLLVASVSFSLLTSAVSSGELQVKGTVARNWKTAYDILVRPPDSFDPLERGRGLVRENYLSGIFGGITVGQWREVLDLPGVQVAAPVANLGFVLPANQIALRIDHYLNREPAQLYRVGLRWIASNGASSYPSSNLYVYFTRRSRFVAPATGEFGTLRPIQEVVPGREPVTVCPVGFIDGIPRPMRTPYYGRDPATTYLQCFSERSPRLGRFNLEPFREGVGTVADARFPILLAAIDPAQEARLLGLDEAVVSGRYLGDEDRARTTTQDVAIPVLASSRTYVDQRLEVTVERLNVPRRAVFPDVLADADAFEFVTSLPGDVVGREVLDPGSMYEAMLDRFDVRRPVFAINEFWTTSPVRYTTVAPDRLAVVQVQNPDSVWKNPGHDPFFPAPSGNEDVQFRELTGYPSPCPADLGGCVVAAGVTVVGRFDPQLLLGFSPLSEVPLESYYPPQAEPADVSSKHALDGRPLLPSMNLGDYISQPPFMFTTLRAAEAFLSPRYFSGSDPTAPISVIRVRVADVTGPDPLSRERIRRVAQLIQERTGLAVDITAGSSRLPLLVELPAGDFGRPPLLLREGWVEKGVAVRILQALDRKSLTLFLLVLVVCGFFLANAAFASVRARRMEIGTLLSLGWSQGAIFRAVLGELALVGTLAGIAGSLLAALLVQVLSLEMSLLATSLVAPIALVLALLSGLVPAWQAARTIPLEAVRPTVSGRSPHQSVRRIAQLALQNLRRLPSRTLLGALGLFVAVGALTLLLAVNMAFQGVVVGTLLGNTVSFQVRGVDLLSVALAVVLGGLSIADVLFLNLRERAPELVTLRASGWGERQLRLLVAFEGQGMGLLGALPGAVAGVLLASLVAGYEPRVALAGAVSAMMGMLIALAASLIPASLMSGMTPPAVLAEE